MENHRAVVLIVTRACGIAIALYGVLLLLLGILGWLFAGETPNAAIPAAIATISEMRSRALASALVGDCIIGLAGVFVFRSAPVLTDIIIRGPDARS